MGYQQRKGKRGMKLDTAATIIVLFLLPRFSIQEISHLPVSSNGHGERNRHETSLKGTPNFSKDALNDNIHSSVHTPKLGVTTSGNVSLNELADNINRLEGNLASLIQSFLALQRSVFNLEQLQELLVLLLEDILKQTGNMDRDTKDVDHTTGTNSASDDSDNVDISDNGVDSAEIDETGEETGGGNGDRVGNGGDNINDRSAGDGTGGGLSNKDKGGTDPFDASNKGMLRQANKRRIGGTVTAENRHFHNQIHHDSNGGGSSEDDASASAEDGGTNGGTNSILSKGISSNKAPSQSSGKPQLSEPLMSISAQLEARLNDMIQRLNPNANSQGGSRQRLAHIRAISGDQQASHHGESPLAPRPIFEPLEIVAGSAENSAPIDGKVAITSQGVRFKERMPVVSHGGPLVGPEDFSSSFMERLDIISSKESLNEHSTGMISNLMHKTQEPAHHSGKSERKGTQLSKDKILTPSSTRSFDDQILQEKALVTTTPAIPDDFDQMIATLLQDLSNHLRKQRTYHDEQSRTSDIIDKAVIQLSKLTWIQTPAQNNSSEIPEYMIHMENNAPASQSMEVNQYSDLHATESKTDAESSGGTAGLIGVAADRVLSTHVPTTEENNYTTPFSEKHDKANDQSITKSPQATTLVAFNREKARHTDKNTQGPWDWLRKVKPISRKTDYSLALLIELLSKLSSEEHNISKELAVFSDTGQKLTKNRAMSENSQVTAGISNQKEMTDMYGNNGQSINQNRHPDDTDGVESEDDDSSEDLDANPKRGTLETKQRLDHMNSVFSDGTNTWDDTNRIISNYNETDSPSSEEDYRDENSSNESKEGDDDDVNPYKTNDDKGEENDDPSQDNVDHNNIVPSNLDSLRPTQSSFNKNKPMLHGGMNEVANSNYIKNPAYKEQLSERKDRGDHDKVNKERLYKDDLDNGQSEERDSEKNEASDNEDFQSDYDYLSGQTTNQETQLYGPPINENPSEESYISQSNIPKSYVNHVISKRNIKTAPYPDAFTLKSLQELHQPLINLSRKKRQADIFWQQFLGFGSSPIRHEKIPATHGNVQSLTNQLGQQIPEGQGHLQSLVPKPNQNIFQTPSQLPNQQNQIGSSQGQGPLQYPIPPFRGYPQYSRYNNYLGFSYPDFGYSGYPGYHGMNHEPGESPSFEGGPSADIMEEVLNSLFQRYWENVRNMFTTRGPSTTPENEYEGPITTSTTTAAPTTTKVKTTTAAATTSMPATMAPTKPQPLYSPGTPMAPTLIDTTNNTVNATNTTATEEQINEAQPPTRLEGLAFSQPLVSLSQASLKSTTDKIKNSALPPDFFPRKIQTKTSPFPFL